MKKIYYWIGIAIMFLFSACTREEFAGEALEGAPVRFEVYDGGFDGASRASGEETEVALDVLKYYFVRNGRIVKGLNTGGNTSQIKVDGLQPGAYTLLLLGVKGDYQADGAVLHELETPSDVWLEFPSGHYTKSLQADYFYAAYSFEVKEGEVFSGRVPMKHVAGKVDFDLTYASQYVEASVQDVVLDMPDVRFYTQFRADDTFDGLSSGGLEQVSLKDGKSSLLLMPTTTGQTVNGSVKLITKNHRSEVEENLYVFEKQSITSNRKDGVGVHLANKDGELGMIYCSNQTFNENTFYRILQDTEKKEVFYNTSQRWCYINEPLQVSVTEDKKLHLRYYCARPVKGVTVYAKFEGTENEFVELAYVDEIPDFGDLTYNLDAFDKERIFQTESGRYISLILPQNLSANVEFKLTSSDGLLAKFQRMTSKWRIIFASYGGDPDKEDGGTVESWLGIRPVHIRSALCILQNIAYMLTFKDLHEQVRWTDYDLKDDKNVPIVGDDRYEILKKMINMQGLKLGLVRNNDGIRGLGGYGIMGVDQEAWVGCYWQSGILSRNLPAIIHEIGHNMGYMGHKGCMTDYGPEAYISSIIFPQFYWKKWNEGDIIIDKDYVQASNSPYLYRFK